MKITSIIVALCGVFLLQGCGSPSQSRPQHDAACLNNAVVGALIGGTVGNQFFSGNRRNMAVATGAAAGAAIRTRYRC